MKQDESMYKTLSVTIGLDTSAHDTIKCNLTTSTNMRALEQKNILELVKREVRCPRQRQQLPPLGLRLCAPECSSSLTARSLSRSSCVSQTPSGAPIARGISQSSLSAPIVRLGLVTRLRGCIPAFHCPDADS